ncbi:NADPH-dependent 7-cyano-7-deazaguanine reductase [Thalassocella blandensis]|nr:NADPH-dependent 7-cyano-7-deazaguanine reductase [Thalassocella blandensis]
MSEGIQLGKDALYVDHYDAELLVPIPRSESRAKVFGATLPFMGKDIWTSYELSWLSKSGKPQVAIAEFEFPYDSQNIIESKSFKYYLNSFNQTFFDSMEEVRQTLIRDLSQAAGGDVSVDVQNLSSDHQIYVLPGTCVDNLNVNVNQYTPNPELLTSGRRTVEKKQLFSHLLKSNCPVTGQPDWATVWIEYSGTEIIPESFLAYVISYRQHQDFHENCVESMFKDIMRQCQPSTLSVYARYTRRGGLDINPFRTNAREEVPVKRLARQ